VEQFQHELVHDAQSPGEIRSRSYEFVHGLADKLYDSGFIPGQFGIWAQATNARVHGAVFVDECDASGIEGFTADASDDDFRRKRAIQKRHQARCECAFVSDVRHDDLIAGHDDLRDVLVCDVKQD
jgi:hypothetical protein